MYKGQMTWIFNREDKPKTDVFDISSILYTYSPDPKGHVRYCHHLAFVVHPLTFHILIYSSEITGPNGTKLGRKHLYKVLYKVSSFRPTLPTNMAAKGNSCFWLANIKKIFSSETAWPNGAKLGRKHLCKILYKTSSFSSIRPTRTTDAKWWQYLTWPFGSGELKMSPEIT
jgi:hypothetical protein